LVIILLTLLAWRTFPPRDPGPLLGNWLGTGIEGGTASMPNLGGIAIEGGGIGSSNSKSRCSPFFFKKLYNTSG